MGLNYADEDLRVEMFNLFKKIRTIVAESQ